MPNTTETSVRWLPQTPTDRELVLSELNAILSSHHFRNSKRYPALLNYVVNKALDGYSGELKERPLGVEFFNRTPDYDTNTDPVVRFSAGEVRKRIAQFYHERGGESALQVNLPLGSYVPEFKLRSSSLELNEESVPVPGAARPTDQGTVASGISTSPGKAPASRGRATIVFRWRFFWPVALLVALAPTGIYAFHRKAASTVAEKPGLVCIDFDKDGKMIVNAKQPLLPGGRWNKQA